MSRLAVWMVRELTVTVIDILNMPQLVLHVKSLDIRKSVIHTEVCAAQTHLRLVRYGYCCCVRVWYPKRQKL